MLLYSKYTVGHLRRARLLLANVYIPLALALLEQLAEDEDPFFRYWAAR